MIEVNRDDKIFISNILFNDLTFLSPLKNIYYCMIEKYSFKENQKISGLIFFYACIIYFMSITNNAEKYIKDILDYNILYLLVDNLIDDGGDKKIFRKMKMTILFPSIFRNFKNEKLKTIRDLYYNFILKYPKLKKEFIKLFKYEIDGHKIEKQKDLSYEKYYFNCLNKGNQTIKIINKILKIDIYNIGFIVQLIDDLMDIKEDLKSNIYTLANVTLDREKNLDSYVNFIFCEINKIEKFEIFKYIFKYIVMYEVTKNPDYFSQELFTQIEKYALLDYRYIDLFRIF